MPREMRGKGFLLEKTAREGAQVGRNREKDLTLGSQRTGAGISPNSSTLPSQDSRSPRRYHLQVLAGSRPLIPVCRSVPRASLAGARR